MNGIFGDLNFEPIQLELAVWPVCSRAAFFLPTRIQLKATGAEAIPQRPIMVDVGGLEPPGTCLQSGRFANSELSQFSSELNQKEPFTAKVRAGDRFREAGGSVTSRRQFLGAL